MEIASLDISRDKLYLGKVPTRSDSVRDYIHEDRALCEGRHSYYEHREQWCQLDVCRRLYPLHVSTKRKKSACSYFYACALFSMAANPMLLGPDKKGSPALESTKIWINGGGFPAFWYNFGYAQALLHGVRPEGIEGYSAGALVAVMLACEVCVEKVADVALSLVPMCQIGSLGEVVRVFCDRLLPEDCHARLTGHVKIAMCDPSSFSTKIVSSWASKTEVIACLVATSFIPGFVAFARKDPYYGCIDGLFAYDLDKYRSHGKLVISRPKSGLCGICSNMIVFDKPTALGFYDEGRRQAEDDFGPLR